MPLAATLQAEESLAIDFATFVFRHSHQQRGTPPSLLRSVLEELLPRHPALPQLVALYAKNEQGGKIAGRLRRQLDAICPRVDSTALWVMALQSEAALLDQGSFRSKNV